MLVEKKVEQVQLSSNSVVSPIVQNKKASLEEKDRFKESVTKDPRERVGPQCESEPSSDFALRRASLTGTRKLA